MIVKTETDGEITDVSIEDNKHHVNYLITVHNGDDNSVYVCYENNDGVEFTLLDISKDGAIITDKPKEV